MRNRCYLCKVEEETSDHLSLFCKKTTMLWSLLFSLFDVQQVLHSSIKRNLIGWHGAFVSKRKKKAWRVASLCLMWTLWKERKERVFNDMERFDQALKLSFLYTFVNWGRVYLEDHYLSMIDFIEWLLPNQVKGFRLSFCLTLGRCLYTSYVLFSLLLGFTNTNSYLPIKKIKEVRITVTDQAKEQSEDTKTISSNIPIQFYLTQSRLWM